MSEHDDKIRDFRAKIVRLEENQAKFQIEIAKLRAELAALQLSGQEKRGTDDDVKNEIKNSVRDDITPETKKRYEPVFTPKRTAPRSQNRDASLKTRSNIEKFIGENLISKVGIVILVIGVGIFAKFAIDNNWITPLMRIAGGYAAGISLVALGVRLKAKYRNFSAVLLAGGMTINYFITFFAYSFYALIDQSAAFALMVLFTCFTVISAVIYDRQIIAHLGLVGAYLVPFLLNEDSGRYAALFSYIVLLNIGILAVSIRKYWKPLFYTSFAATWLIYGAWYVDKYPLTENFSLALGFSFIFFLIFYTTFIIYKIISDENIAAENVGLVLANAFIFYGFGYRLIEGSERFHDLSGAFTVANSTIHFFYAFIINRLDLERKDLVYLSAILVLTFITIAAPVQIDGSAVTLFWTAEAAFFFWFGRSRSVRIFEYFSYPVMILASLSLFYDWVVFYGNFGASAVFPVLNAQFAAGAFFAAAFTLINVVDRSTQYEKPEVSYDFRNLFKLAIGAVLVASVYNIFRIEIGNFFYYPEAGDDSDIFNIIWQINYSMLFFAVLSFVNLERWKSETLGFANILAAGLTVFVFLTLGLYLLDVLRADYFSENSRVGVSYFLIRYLCAFCFAVLSFSIYKYSVSSLLSRLLPQNLLKAVFDLSFYLAVLVLTSFEVLTWFEIFSYEDALKYGLSITWGAYAVFLLILGIIYRKLHPRIFAIVLLGITVAKLFLYDIADLATIPKTIAFVALGILLLFVSFLYTKYKNFIFGDENV